MWPHPEEYLHCAHDTLTVWSLLSSALEVSIPSEGMRSSFGMPTGRPHPFTQSEEYTLLDVAETFVDSEQPNR
jgi:hypothetical protein